MRNLDVIPTPTPPIILFLRAQITGWAVPWHTHTHSHARTHIPTVYCVQSSRPAMTKGSGRAATALFVLRETRLGITTDDRWMTISRGFEYLPLASFKEH
ncbi:hypothetical protein CLIM01_08916 [Colletotrichum limetticola]|uniref:Uncharacterized protein n=1 Tax=Colletotrichum limetticola TaxID=1209924 RepID=A0ABQ9PQE1_9PEZI|nr:hypothetical protein CLIM01_08916 [Colletotrichum limetticola]